MAGIRGLKIMKVNRPEDILLGEKDGEHYRRLLGRYDEILAMPTEEFLNVEIQNELIDIRAELLTYARKVLKEPLRLLLIFAFARKV